MHSKSFAAQLPALTTAELDRLRGWGDANCSQSVFYRDGNCVMWFVSRERARSREQFARAVRGVLRTLAIDASSLRRGRWLTLTEDAVVRAECPAEVAIEEQPGSPSGAGPSCDDDEEDGVRVVSIGRR